MDHLSLPPVRISEGHLRIPCISTTDFDADFESFPRRQGWEFSRAKYLDINQIRDGDILLNGATASVAELQPFLQTWLYFGTLRQLFDNVTVEREFVSHEIDGRRFLRTEVLNNLLDEWLEHQGGLSDRSPSQTSHIEQACQRLAKHLALLFNSLSSSQRLTSSATVLATAVLGKSPELFLLTTCEVFLFDKPRSNPWNTAFRVVLRPEFERSGWCPSIVARLIDGLDLSLFSIYYCLHLKLPSGASRHRLCTSNVCTTSQIDLKTYEVMHIDSNCHCLPLGLNATDVQDILGNGNLPLISVERHKGSADVKLAISESGNQIPFVAVSHVWADGLGNPDSNSLPTCSLQYIYSLAQELPRDSDTDPLIPLWIDTICVPVEPPVLKQQALALLRIPYLKARHVLVLDKYLLSLRSCDLDIVAVFAYLTSSNWIGHLWTSQEGRLARQCWFQFQDRAISLRLEVDNLIPSRPLRDVRLYHDTLLHNFSTLWTATRDFQDVNFESTLDLITNLRSILRTRSVSVKSDEALCLFTLSNMDLNLVSATPPALESRMTLFWQQLSRVPAGLVFSKSTSKLESTGFR